MSSEPSTDPITITVRQARKLSGLGKTLISQKIGTGEIPSSHVGHGRGRRLIDYAGFKRWLAARPGAPTPEPTPAPEVIPPIDDLIGALETHHGVIWREVEDFDVILVAGKKPLLDALRRRRIARK